MVLALNFMVHKSSYCKCSLAWCQVRPFLLFTILTHPLQMRDYLLRYAGTDRIKKSHYNRGFGININTAIIAYLTLYNEHSLETLMTVYFNMTHTKSGCLIFYARYSYFFGDFGLDLWSIWSWTINNLKEFFKSNMLKVHI